MTKMNQQQTVAEIAQAGLPTDREVDAFCDATIRELSDNSLDSKKANSFMTVLRCKIRVRELVHKIGQRMTVAGQKSLRFAAGEKS